MKIADVLRKLADTVEQHENPAQPDDKIQNPADLSLVNTGEPVETPCNQDAGTEDDVMIPPLQLKTELLKKAVGVDSVYDENGPRAEEVVDSESREIEKLKHNAGIPVASVMSLSDDEPLDN